MYKKYLKKSVIIFTVLMLVIGSINFIIDPGEIYLKKILADDIKSAEFANKLFNSKYGIVDKWSRRIVKTTLAKESGNFNFDCIVLGSSRAMQISHIRNTGNIKNQCNSLLNLGVSGGSIEDISIFSYLFKKSYSDISPIYELNSIILKPKLSRFSTSAEPINPLAPVTNIVFIL